jgi:hypothetical protein
MKSRTLLRALNNNKTSLFINNNARPTATTFTLKRNAHQDVMSVNTTDYFNKHTTFQVATVFGCTGFLGRYIVAELAQAGYQVITPWRNDEFVCLHTRVLYSLSICTNFIKCRLLCH